MLGFRSYSLRAGNVKRNWYVVDAQESTVGRVASFVALVLMGKHKPDYTPHMDCGDKVVIINARDSKFSGRKLLRKRYYRHSGYPGGIKENSPKVWLDDDEKCNRVLESAIKGMLGKNAMGRARMKNVMIYPGADHPHAGQMPRLISVKNKKSVVVSE